MTFDQILKDLIISYTPTSTCYYVWSNKWSHWLQQYLFYCYIGCEDGDNYELLYSVR